jgi:hypothetical protein
VTILFAGIMKGKALLLSSLMSLLKRYYLNILNTTIFHHSSDSSICMTFIKLEITQMSIASVTISLSKTKSKIFTSKITNYRHLLIDIKRKNTV